MDINDVGVLEHQVGQVGKVVALMLVGHTFFGTEAKDVSRRPQLWLEHGP